MLLKWTFSCEHSESILIVRNKGKFKHRTFAYVITNKHLFTIVSEVIINWNYCFWQPLSSVTDVTIVPALLVTRRHCCQGILCLFVATIISRDIFLGKKKRKKTIATLSKNRNFFIDCNLFAIGRRFSSASGLNQAAFNRVVAGDMKVDLSLATYVHSHIASKLSLVATKL